MPMTCPPIPRPIVERLCERRRRGHDANVMLFTIPPDQVEAWTALWRSRQCGQCRHRRAQDNRPLTPYRPVPKLGTTGSRFAQCHAVGAEVSAKMPAGLCPHFKPHPGPTVAALYKQPDDDATPA